MATDPARERAVEVMSVLMDRMQQYHQLLADLRGGAIDGREFRRRAVITGTVQQIDGLWVFDLPNMRWVYYDGVELWPVPAEEAAPQTSVAPNVQGKARPKARANRA
jgi:hypothetical protein